MTDDTPRLTISGPSASSNATKSTLRNVKINPYKAPSQTSSGDRFITCKYSLEAAHYLVTKKSQSALKKNEIDVFKQVDSLSVKWRKKFMNQLMVKENIIPGVRQKQVLRGSHLSLENKLPGNLAGQSKELWDEEYFEDGMWKSKPRKRPLIGIMDSILDMPGYRATSRYRGYRLQLLDWSSKNMIAARIHDSVTFHDTLLTSGVEPLQNLKEEDVCALKWNNAGNKVALCNLQSETKLYCVEKQKVLWKTLCTSVTKYDITCFVRCLCWSQDDQHIVTGCVGVISVYSASSGMVVNSMIVHTKPILALAFSVHYRYLVSTALDMTIRIFFWPNMTPYLDISYYEPIRAVAWHPHESGMLCIGGGTGDASLSLWNVNKLNPVSYRHVHFHGAVENLAWNKHSGELVVHWSYWEGRNRYTVMPVLASLDRVVDVVPVDKALRVISINWNSDQTQLAVQYDESLSLWNFFGNEYQYRLKCKKPQTIRETQINTNDMTFKEFKHFTIR